MRTKQATTLSVLLSAIAFGIAVSASAQTVVVQPAPDTSAQTVVVQPAPDALPPPSDRQTLIVVPPTPTPVPDAAANEKCKMVIPAEYWDCVNSHNGGQ